MRNLIGAKINTMIGAILGVLFVIGIIQIIQLEFYPWINVTIASGLPLITFSLSFLIRKKRILSFKVIYSILSIQLLGAIYFLLNPLLLKNYWNLLLLPTVIIIIFLFLELAEKKTKNILTISKICLSILVILMLSKVVFPNYYIDYIITYITIGISALLLFSKNKIVENTK